MNTEDPREIYIRLLRAENVTPKEVEWMRHFETTRCGQAILNILKPCVNQGEA